MTNNTITSDTYQNVRNIAANVSNNQNPTGKSRNRAKWHFVSIVLLMVLGFFLASASQAFAAIAIRGGASNFTTGNGSSSVIINKPAGVVAGDVMIVTLSSYGGSSNPTLLSGWTSISNVLLFSSSRYAAVFYRVVDGTEGTSFTFTITGASNSAGAIVAFSGVDPVNPLDATIQPISTAGNTTAIPATTITTNTANAAVIMFGMCSNAQARTFSGWTTTSPGGLTEIYDYQGASYEFVGAAWAIKAIAGSTGAGSATLSATGSNVGGILIALKPLSLVPAITNFTPSSACAGSGASVVITGTNFTGVTAVNFYNSQSASFTYNSPTQITAILPAVATTGPISVTIPAGTGTSSGNFTVNTSPSASVSNQKNPTCYAGTDGEITIQASGGTGPYQFSVDNGVTYKSGGNPYAYTELSANIAYKIRVKDSNNCLSMLIP
jgi:hypothetical protein